MRHQLLGRRRRGQVAGETLRGTAGRAHLGNHRVHRLLRASIDDDPRALARQRVHDRPPDARRAAADQRELAVQIEVHGKLLSCAPVCETACRPDQ
jgi:transposase InsO family protein